MRHGRKSSSGKFNGHKTHLIKDVSSDIITNIDVSSGNCPNQKMAEPLIDEAKEDFGVRTRSLAKQKTSLHEEAIIELATKYGVRPTEIKRWKKTATEGMIELFKVELDWVSRYILSWETSTTLEVDFCIQALEKALSIAGPEIFNSDQGCQFTSVAFSEYL